MKFFSKEIKQERWNMKPKNKNESIHDLLFQENPSATNSVGLQVYVKKHFSNLVWLWWHQDQLVSLFVLPHKN